MKNKEIAKLHTIDENGFILNNCIHPIINMIIIWQ